MNFSGISNKACPSPRPNGMAGGLRRKPVPIFSGGWDEASQMHHFSNYFQLF